MEEQMQEGQGSVHPAVNGSLSASQAPLSGVQESQGSATPARLAHTPGPWDAEYGTDGYYFLGHSDGIELREVKGGANARLIAAAPDLLAALQDIADDYADRFDLASPSTNPGIKSVVLRARTWIARATGASND